MVSYGIGHKELIVNAWCKWWVGPGVLLISLAVACSDSPGEPCASTDDCFAGQVCYEGHCTPEDEVPPNSSNDTPDAGDAGNGDNSSTTDPDGGNGDNQSPGDDAGDAGQIDADPDGENDAHFEACSFSASGEHSCHSGHEDLQGTGSLTLLPDDVDEVGCTAFDAESSSEFVSFEEETWTIRACSEVHHRMRLPLWRCANETYPAYIRIEPVDPVCPLDGPYVSLELTRETSSTIEECTEAGRDHNCYLEYPLDHGGVEWVLKPENTSVVSSYAWTIYAHVETEPDAYFDYQVTTWVPPYPPED